MSEVRTEGWSGIENRRHKRVLLQVPIECHSEERRLLAKAENISSSGVLVRCSQPFPEDSELSVSFTLPGSTQAIIAKARVAHAVPAVFMGLEMISVAPDAQQRIDAYVEAAEPVFKPK
jgi:PilZ domain-containing protein